MTEFLMNYFIFQNMQYRKINLTIKSEFHCANTYPFDIIYVNFLDFVDFQIYQLRTKNVQLEIGKRHWPTNGVLQLFCQFLIFCCFLIFEKKLK